MPGSILLKDLGWMDFLYESYDQLWMDPVHQHMIVRKGQAFHVASLPDDDESVDKVTLSEPYHVEKQLDFLPRAGKLVSAEVLQARFSLNMKLLALQFSQTQVKVVDLAQGHEWTIVIKGTKKPNSILPEGILWSDHGGNSQDLIIVTAKRGLELHKISSKNLSCRFSRNIETLIYGFWYEPLHRVLLLSLGPQNTKMRVYFLIRDAKAASPLPFLELPRPEKGPSFHLPNTPSSHTDIGVHVLYGIPCAIVLDQTVWEVNVFTLSKTRTTHTHRLSLQVPGSFSLPPAFSKNTDAGAVRFSCPDNLLVVHLCGQGTSLLFDLEEELTNIKTLGGEMPCIQMNALGYGTCPIVRDADDKEGEITFSQEYSIYNGDFILMWPDWVIDTTFSRIFQIEVALESLVVPPKLTPKLAAVIQRRGLPFVQPIEDAIHRVDLEKSFDCGNQQISHRAKAILIRRLHELLQCRTPLQTISNYLRVLMGPYLRFSTKTESTPVADAAPSSPERDIFFGMNKNWRRSQSMRLEPLDTFQSFSAAIDAALKPILQMLNSNQHQPSSKEGEPCTILHPDLNGQKSARPISSTSTSDILRCPKGLLVVSQSEIFAGAYLPLLKETTGVANSSSDGSVLTKDQLSLCRYLASAILELAFVFNRSVVTMEPYFAITAFGLLLAPQSTCRSVGVERVIQVLSSRILPDSRELALCLIQCGAMFPSFSACHFAGFDMLKRLNNWTLIPKELLRHNHEFEAASFFHNLQAKRYMIDRSTVSTKPPFRIGPSRSESPHKILKETPDIEHKIWNPISSSNDSFAFQHIPSFLTHYWVVTNRSRLCLPVALFRLPPSYCLQCSVAAD